MSDFLAAVPETVLTILATGLVALIPVLVTNYLQRRGQREERKSEVRREVYLEVADALGLSWQFFSEILIVHKPVEDLRSLLEKVNGAFRKLQLVAREDTIMSSLNYQREFLEVSQRLLELRARVDQLNSHINRLEVRKKLLGDQRWLLLGLAKEQGQMTSENVLARFNLLTGEESRLEADMESTRIKRADSIHGLISEVGESLPLVEKAFASLAIAVREELGFEIDGENYYNAVAEDSEKKREMLLGFLEKIKLEAVKLDSETGQAPTTSHALGTSTYAGVSVALAPPPPRSG